MESLKKFMKKVMPFVHIVKEQYVKKGMAALASARPVDQEPIQLENREYIENSLELDRFSIKFTDEADVEPIISETVMPGASLMHFFPLREAISLTSRNVRVANAPFDVNVEVIYGDSVAIVARKSRKLNKSIKPRFNHLAVSRPSRGDRKVFSCLDPLPFHERLEDSAIFAADIGKKDSFSQRQRKSISHRRYYCLYCSVRTVSCLLFCYILDSLTRGVLIIELSGFFCEF
ncbi:hypothetical protein OESDEN_14014 [Oesophagostomum dentatum]|uniref:Uncharacterized protein n=1 Tax=Oesophagostomum dentatum TaxID=61180 RepID=A0A0B1SRU7_OESDE|nr:hypothetical protein OESDEN_14014 [Oesophagostomum dentatum]